MVCRSGPKASGARRDAVSTQRKGRVYRENGRGVGMEWKNVEGRLRWDASARK